MVFVLHLLCKFYFEMILDIKKFAKKIKYVDNLHLVFPNVKLLLNHNRITKITITNLCTDFIQVTQILPLISMCRFRVSCCLYVLFLDHSLPLLAFHDFDVEDYW